MELTSNQKLFVKRMTTNEEEERQGYELIIAKGWEVEFFDHLLAAGLFDHQRSPGPKPAKEEGYVHIPYWPALGYLVACARFAGLQKDEQLANKILGVVRSVSSVVDENGSPRWNYHTSRAFAEIFGLLPTTSIAISDIDLIGVWLSDPFDRGLVAHELDKGVLKGLLNSDVPDDWNKAVRILRHCTEVKLAERAGERDKYVTVVDDYWLQKLIQNHAPAFGARRGKESAEVFYGRLSQVFGDGTRDKFSYLFRPAIEEHTQNRSWNEPENRFVDGMRDVVTTWVQHDPMSSGTYVQEMLHSDFEIVRRIAIHVLDERWGVLHPLFAKELSAKLFSTGNHHELYRLLKNHFSEMSNEVKSSVVEAIEAIDTSHLDIEDKDEHLRHVQRTWLSSIFGKGSEKADKWFEDLSEKEGHSLSPHPDFLTYMESSWGHGSSPYSVESLIAFAKDGSLIQTLNDFVEADRWNGPTVHALSDALQEVVTTEPKLIIDVLPEFLKAKPAYQYALISGLAKAWGKPGVSWPDEYWERIFKFLEDLILPASFWETEPQESRAWGPCWEWIAPNVADFLRAGTTNDEHAYSQRFFPRAQALISCLLENAEESQSLSDDPMFHAINSLKGKAIEALFSLALRMCRINKEVHQQAWESIRPLFDRELAKCSNGNYEFSTIAAEYFAHLEFLSVDWLHENAGKLFPKSFPENFNAAICGLAYSPVSKVGYQILIKENVIDVALRTFKSKQEALAQLIERVAIAYLWGDESLDSPRFSYLFDSIDIEALSGIANFFWGIQREELKDNQKSAVIQFWKHCVDWGRSVESVPATLFGRLALLSCYLDTLDDFGKNLLLATAPYAEKEFNADRVLKELDRLFDTNPAAVSEVFLAMLENYTPSFDLEGHMHSIISKLASAGMRGQALQLTSQLRHLQGMPELFSALEKGGND